jgi:hypothetical protein
MPPGKCWDITQNLPPLPFTISLRVNNSVTVPDLVLSSVKHQQLIPHRETTLVIKVIHIYFYKMNGERGTKLHIILRKDNCIHTILTSILSQ